LDEVVSGKLPKIIFPKDTSFLTLSGKIYGATPSQLRDQANIILLISQKKADDKKMLVLPIAPMEALMILQHSFLIQRIFITSFLKDLVLLRRNLWKVVFRHFATINQQPAFFTTTWPIQQDIIVIFYWPMK
jgi:hypothetical protein